MTIQTTDINQLLTKYRRKDYYQYNRQHRLYPYIGTQMNNIVQRDTSLSNEGNLVRVAFTDDLDEFNIGTGTLEGNESVFDQHHQDCRPIWHRKAVKIKKSEKKKAFTDHYRIQRRVLRTWASNNMRTQFYSALDAIAHNGRLFQEIGTPAVGATPAVSAHNYQVSYAEALPAERDAYVANNEDRLLFGSATGNLVAGDMAASLANIDAVNDRMSWDTLRLIKRLAQVDQWATQGRRAIRPVSGKDEKGREMFVCFMPSAVFRDFATDPKTEAFNTDARMRGVEDHPIFQGGDLMADGIIVKEIFEADIAAYAGAGNGGVDVAPYFFCGAQALLNPVGQRLKMTSSDNTDYQFLKGVGTEEQYAVEKAFFRGPSADGVTGSKQHGMITGYASATQD